MAIFEEEDLHQISNPTSLSGYFHWPQEEFLQFGRGRLLPHTRTIEPPFALERSKVVGDGNVIDAVDLVEAGRWVGPNHEQAALRHI